MLDQASFDALRLCDAHLTGIEWKESGRDLCIALASASGTPVTIVCAWAHSLQIDLKTSAHRGGHPLTWEAMLTPKGDGWRLVLDFAGDGSIELLCNGVFVAEAGHGR